MPYRSTKNAPIIWPHSSVPAENPGSLVPGQIALNRADGVLWYRGKDGRPAIFDPSVKHTPKSIAIDEGFLLLRTSLPPGETAEISLRTSAEGISVRWWDGTIDTIDAQDSSAFYKASKTADANQPFGQSPEKYIYAWSTDSAGSPSGSITGVSVSASRVNAVDLNFCGSLTSLTLTDNKELRSLSFAYAKNLVDLTLDGCVGLSDIGVPNTRDSSLTNLSAKNTRISDVNLSQLANLKTVYMDGTKVDNVSLPVVNGGLLDTVSFVGCGLKSFYVQTANNLIDVRNNDMDSNSLDSLYSRLERRSPEQPKCTLDIRGNPGWKYANANIPQSKGYAIKFLPESESDTEKA